MRGRWIAVLWQAWSALGNAANPWVDSTTSLFAGKVEEAGTGPVDLDDETAVRQAFWSIVERELGPARAADTRPRTRSPRSTRARGPVLPYWLVILPW